MREDYGAGVTLDAQDDNADRAPRWIEAPLLTLWDTGGQLPHWYGSVASIWRTWATDVECPPINAGHDLPEEAARDVFDALWRFFTGPSK